MRDQEYPQRNLDEEHKVVGLRILSSDEAKSQPLYRTDPSTFRKRSWFGDVFFLSSDVRMEGVHEANLQQDLKRSHKRGLPENWVSTVLCLKGLEKRWHRGGLVKREHTPGGWESVF